MLYLENVRLGLKLELSPSDIIDNNINYNFYEYCCPASFLAVFLLNINVVTETVDQSCQK